MVELGGKSDLPPTYLISMYAALAITNLPGWTRKIVLRMGISFWLMTIVAGFIGTMVNLFFTPQITANLPAGPTLLITLFFQLGLSFLIPLWRTKALLAHFNLSDSWKHALVVSLITFFGVWAIYILLIVALVIAGSGTVFMQWAALLEQDAAIGSVFQIFTR